MRENEKLFFTITFKLYQQGKPDYIRAAWDECIVQGIAAKQLYYYLLKWSDIGFLDFGVTPIGGWFEYSKIPVRYLNLVEN